MLTINRGLIEVKNRLQNLEACLKELSIIEQGLLKEVETLTRSIRVFEEFYYGMDRSNDLDTSGLRNDERNCPVEPVSSDT